jgi:hypothetical protein
MMSWVELSWVSDHQSGTDGLGDHQSGTDGFGDHQSGVDDLKLRNMATQSTIIGKLCQLVLALIKWKKGLSEGVSEGAIWILEVWLHNRGISIYTDCM